MYATQNAVAHRPAGAGDNPNSRATAGNSGDTTNKSVPTMNSVSQPTARQRRGAPTRFLHQIPWGPYAAATTGSLVRQ